MWRLGEDRGGMRQLGRVLISEGVITVVVSTSMCQL